MATYLCVKVNNTTKKFTAKESKEAGKPYLRVPGGYFPLTTETTTGTQLKVRANNTNYRIVETYKTTINTTTNTTTTVQAQSSSSVTTSDFDEAFYRIATADGYIPYIATYTHGSKDNFDRSAINRIRAQATGTNNSAKTFRILTMDSTSNSNATARETEIIYYNSTKINCYRIRTFPYLIIKSQLDSATLYYNSNYLTKAYYTDIQSGLYVGHAASENQIGYTAQLTNFTLFGGPDMAFSTENYTYETVSNTVVNTTIETTSQ